LGGEPLLRKDVLELGVKMFLRNTIVTNGTLPIPQLDANVLWLVSFEAPEVINDEIRGKGVFKKAIKTLNNLPDNFNNELQCQCTVSKKNIDYIDELAEILLETPIEKLFFSVYVPVKNDTSEFAWKSLEERDSAVKKIIDLKKKYPLFIRNNEFSIEAMLSQNASQYTKNCWSRENVVPLYLGEEGFETAFCSYGNNVDCDMCGSVQAFYFSSIMRT